MGYTENSAIERYDEFKRNLENLKALEKIEFGFKTIANDHSGILIEIKPDQPSIHMRLNREMATFIAEAIVEKAPALIKDAVRHAEKMSELLKVKAKDEAQTFLDQLVLHEKSAAGRKKPNFKENPQEEMGL